jgi:hypothetical protein
LRLFERDGREIITAVIYTSDVKKADTGLKIGSLMYNPVNVMMIDYDGNAIYEELDRKIKEGAELSDLDMLNLIFLPLMKIKGDTPRDELAVNSIKLAQTIKDNKKRYACIAAAYAFAEKYLDDNGRNKIWEVLKMGSMLVEYLEGYLEEEFTKHDNNVKTEIARNAIKEGATVDFVKKITKLPVEIIKRLQAEIGKE